MRRYVGRIGSLLILVTFLASCTFDARDPDEQDLSSLLAVNRGFSTFITLIAEDEDVTNREATSRTISSGVADTGSANDLESIVGNKSPQQVFTEYAEPGEVAEIPDSFSNNNHAYIENFYGDDALEARFSLEEYEPNDDYFLVKLWIYDRSNLYLEYEYEEYLVAGNSWTFYDGSLNENKMITSRSYYYDGSYVDKEILDSNLLSPADPLLVYEIEMPEISQANLGAYTFSILDGWADFPSIETAYDMDEPGLTLADGDFFLKTKGDGRVSQDDDRLYDFENITYYSESQDQERRFSVSFVLQPEKRSSNHLKSVVRSSSLYDESSLISRQIRSVTAHTYRNNAPWQYDTQEIEIEAVSSGNDTKMTYSQVDKTFSNSLNSTPWMHTVMELEEQNAAGGSKRYSGTYQVLWTSWIDNWTVKYEDGVFSMKQKKGSNRNLFGDELFISIDQLSPGGLLSFPLSGGGRFTGTYRSGAFIGQYTPRGGSPYEVTVNSGYVQIGDRYWSNGVYYDQIGE